MTDITDEDRRAARVWAKNWQGDQDDDTSAAARIILATVEAPPLSEDLAHVTKHWETWPTEAITDGLTAATDRAKQMEHDLAEARAEAILWEGKYEDVRESEQSLHIDLADADAEVDHLKRDLTEAYKTRDSRCDEVDRLRAEVERLTDVNETLRRTNNFKGFRERLADVQKQLADVQKGAESNAESLDPADVPAGEAWLVEFYGEKRNAVKDGDDSTPWNTVTAGGLFSYVRNDDVTLIARLVPAPRDITSPDELDKLAPTSIFRDGRGWPGVITDQGEIMRMNRVTLDSTELLRLGPATVLWEQEA